MPCYDIYVNEGYEAETANDGSVIGLPWLSCAVNSQLGLRGVQTREMSVISIDVFP